MPMLLEMIAWEAKYDNKTEAPPQFIKQFNADRDSLCLELMANLDTE